MRRALLAAAVVGLVALPAAAEGKRIRIGSNLKATPDKVESHGADSVFWPRRLPGHRKIKSPARGQVLLVKIKGDAIRHGPPPNTLFHIQVLRPAGNGRVRVVSTSSNFFIPVGGSRDQISTYRPVNMCVHKGDYVAFNDVGGYDPKHYPGGTPFRVFSSTIGATTNFFSKANGTNNGDVFKGVRHKGEELLMRAVIGTHRDSGKFCR